MGGGGSGVSYSRTSGSIKSQDLRSEVKNSLKRTEDRLKSKTPKIIYPTRNVFISFHAADEMQIKLLRHQAKDNRFDFKFRDYSVKEPLKDPWKRYCAERISQSSFTIVMIGEKTASRSAVKWEIAESYRQGKEVVGVRIYKNANHNIPKKMLNNNAKIVDWNLSDLTEILSEISSFP